MSKSNLWEEKLVKLVFHNAAATLIGDAAGLLPSAAAGSVYISLHTADPGEAGDQTTSEATYTSYARVAIARSVGAWTFTTPDTMKNAAACTFPTCTGGTSTVTYFQIGTAASGVGSVLYRGLLTASLAVTNGITPSFAIDQIVATEG